MASFESKISEIFHTETNLSRHFSILVPKIFNESAQSFFRRMHKIPQDEIPAELMILYDIAFIDYFYEDIDNWLLPWIIDNYADEFTQDELGEMAAQAQSHLDFYEVLATQPGKGMQLQSLLTGKELFLNDISSSHHATKWDILLLRCYPWQGKNLATGSARMLSPDSRSYIIERLTKEFEHYKKSFQDNEYAHFTQDCWDILQRIDQEIIQKNKERKILTPFGEYNRKDVIFVVHQLQAALEKLATLKEFEFIEQVEKKDRNNKQKNMQQFHFDWLTTGQEKELEKIRQSSSEGFVTTIHQLDMNGKSLGIEFLGALAIDRYLARLTVNSIELAEYAKTRIPKLLAHSITFKRIAKAQPSEEPAAPPAPIDDKTTDKFIKLYYKEYYAKILDETIPALNNLTPRQARNDPKALPLLIQWLKDFENRELKHKKAGKAFVDVSKLKKELDVKF